MGIEAMVDAMLNEYLDEYEEENWKAGNKVFETEEEAKSYAKALNNRGCTCSWKKTTEEATHRHIKDGYTEKL